MVDSAQPLRILAISGSLRRLSYNTAALRAAQELTPAGLTISLAGPLDLPIYDTDVEATGWPAPVAALRDQVEAADAILVATPEYNYSMPGGLKNAFDWLSRPAGKSPLRGKPMAIIGASTGMVGTARAQMQLRQVAFYNAMPVLASAEVLIAHAEERFDEQGRLTDAATLEHLAKLWWHSRRSRGSSSDRKGNCPRNLSDRKAASTHCLEHHCSLCPWRPAKQAEASQLSWPVWRRSSARMPGASAPASLARPKLCRRSVSHKTLYHRHFRFRRCRSLLLSGPGIHEYRDRTTPPPLS